MVKLLSVRSKNTFEKKFLGDKSVIQTWSHTIQNLFGSPALKQMRFGRSLTISVCANFDNTDYQPNLVALSRGEKRI